MILCISFFLIFVHPKQNMVDPHATPGDLRLTELNGSMFDPVILLESSDTGSYQVFICWCLWACDTEIEHDLGALFSQGMYAKSLR